MLPKVLGRRTKSGAPLVATLLSASGVVFLGFLPFGAIVEILNSLYVSDVSVYILLSIEHSSCCTRDCVFH
jgi:hypothetical protein